MVVRRCPGLRPGLRLLPVFLPPVFSPAAGTRLPDAGLRKCGRLGRVPCGRTTPDTTFSLPGRGVLSSSFWATLGGTVDVAGDVVWSSSFLL